jgi:hypothetical protein
VEFRLWVEPPWNHCAGAVALARSKLLGLGTPDRARTFLQLADRLTKSQDRAEQEQIKEELARLTFGD